MAFVFSDPIKLAIYVYLMMEKNNLDKKINDLNKSKADHIKIRRYWTGIFWSLDSMDFLLCFAFTVSGLLFAIFKEMTMFFPTNFFLAWMFIKAVTGLVRIKIGNEKLEIKIIDRKLAILKSKKRGCLQSLYRLLQEQNILIH